MFNISRIEPAFTKDTYGFTQSLIGYIDGETNKTPNSEKLCAYHEGVLSDQKIAQHAFFIIYQSVLAHPLSAPASRHTEAKDGGALLRPTDAEIDGTLMISARRDLRAFN